VNRREWREPAQYYIVRDKIIRRPHEDFHPIDPNSPLYTSDYAALERKIMSSNRPETEDELPLGLPDRVVITCLYHNDPRKRRVVVTARGAHPVEVCEQDTLGNESWRVERDPPAVARLEALLARAVFALRGEGFGTVDLGKIVP
jgi:hypothetical protein